METTSVCTVTYFSYFHCAPNFRTNRFCLLFPKSVPKRSVHMNVYCIAFTLIKKKDIPTSGFSYECCVV